MWYFLIISRVNIAHLKLYLYRISIHTSIKKR